MADYTTSFFAGVPERVIVELLKDRTTGRNILWSADGGDEITLYDVDSIRPRVYKRLEEQKDRTKKRAEVFTPVKVVKQMNDFLCDEAKDELLYSTTCEITCGEAPFITSRYDTTTGEEIPIENRVGLLDRKLKLARRDEIERVVKTVYGFEFQGDNLLIARVNIWRTIAEYTIESLVDVICWNFWQMNAFTGKSGGVECVIMDWDEMKPVKFNDMLPDETRKQLQNVQKRNRKNDSES